MKRSASEIIRDLEMRIARLEGKKASTTIKGGEPRNLGGVDQKAVKTSWGSVKDLLSDVQEIYNEEYYSHRDETYKKPEFSSFDFEDRWTELGIDNAIFFYTLSEDGENAGMMPYLIADRDDLVKALLETDKGFKSAYEKLIRKYLASKLR